MRYAIRAIERLGEVLRPTAPPQAVEGPTSAPRPELVHERARSHGLGVWWTFGAGLILAGAVIVGIVQNSSPVDLHYLAWHVNVSLIVVVLTTALIAIALDEVGGLIWRRRRRSRIARRSELDQLRMNQHRADETPLAAESPPARAVLDAGAPSRL